MFGIIKNFIPDDYLDDLKNEIIFRQDNVIIDNITVKEERKTCWMSDNEYSYKYGEKMMFPDPISNTVKKIQNIIKEKYGKYYDSILINYYLNGNIGMRYHSDETYDEWKDDTVIVSFGESRILSFREINNYENKTKFNFESGDLIFMKEDCQKIYQHRVLKDKKIQNDRISLVFKKHI
jgi:alkylated DNA repair dioxygenase AlkB